MKRHCGKIGLLVILLGITVILAMVLPSGFWAFMIGVALIIAGILIIRR